MISLDIEEKGIKTFINSKLKKLTGTKGSENTFGNDTQILAEEAVRKLVARPNASAGNFPPAPYWVRGKGLIGGQGNLLRASEEYSDNTEGWKYENLYEGGAAITRATTEIPYAPYVGDANRQTRFHQETGWRTDEQIILEIGSSPLIKTVLSSAVARVAKILNLQ